MSESKECDHVGTVAIVGLPNVGKSTLMNRLLGVRLMAVSSKPQTTRNRVLGIVNHEAKPSAQLVFVDTPGLQLGDGRLRKFMRKEAFLASADCDVVLLLVDASDKRTNTLDSLKNTEVSRLLDQLQQNSIPAVLAINKIDKLESPADLLPMLEDFGKSKLFSSLVPISALKGKGEADLLGALKKRLPAGVRTFPLDMVTDKPEKFFAAELIREQCFRHLGQEVPYYTAVEIERFEERESKNDVCINAAIHVDRDSHKAIVIGKGGSRIKEIGLKSRRLISNLLDCPVHVKLFVKVSPNWSERPGDLKMLGYERT